jgi:hypothetical protein
MTKWTDTFQGARLSNNQATPAPRIVLWVEETSPLVVRYPEGRLPPRDVAEYDARRAAFKPHSHQPAQ